MYSDKEEIMARRMLLCSGEEERLQGKNQIWINNDYSDTVRQACRSVAPILKLARYKDKNAALINNKLLYKGKRYSINEMTTLDLDTASVCMKTSPQSIAFYGRFAPFSNFFPVELKIDNKNYTCVEQFSQSQRALYDGRQDLAQQIMLTKNPVAMKQSGDQCKKRHVEWYKTKAREVMRKALYAKFSQPRLKDLLQRTEQRILIEVNKFDNFWSCGLEGRDPRVQDPHRWPGQNVLGLGMYLWT